jgi:hypothetical protein
LANGCQVELRSPSVEAGLLAYLLTHIGEDNMIMGSDYGHQDQSKEDGMGRCNAGQEKHIANSDRKNSLRQPCTDILAE